MVSVDVFRCFRRRCRRRVGCPCSSAISRPSPQRRHCPGHCDAVQSSLHAQRRRHVFRPDRIGSLMSSSSTAVATAGSSSGVLAAPPPVAHSPIGPELYSNLPGMHPSGHPAQHLYHAIMPYQAPSPSTPHGVASPYGSVLPPGSYDMPYATAAVTSAASTELAPPAPPASAGYHY